MNSKFTFRESLKGFTLVELMIVVAIIGILASIVLGAVNGSKDPMTQYDSSGKRSLPEQQTRDSRTCTISGLDFKLNEDNEVSCIPKGHKEQYTDCNVLINNGDQVICVK